MASALVEEATKRCRLCGEDKPLAAFSRHTGKYLRSHCKPCGVESNREWKAAHPGWELAYRLNRKFGLSVEEYFSMLAAQGGTCAICHSEFGDSMARRLCVDHDHRTGEVRGLLCFNCNTVLGKVRDSVATLRSAIAYIERGESDR